MRRFLFLVACVLFCLTSGCKNNSGKNTRLAHEEMMANATRTEKNGWIEVHLKGTPEVIGYQHGYLLAAEILDLRGAMRQELYRVRQPTEQWLRK